MTPNQRVVASAARHVGAREKPPGSNDDGGGWITRIQRYWRMRFQPWCGMACSDWLREAGVTDVSHPSTWEIVRKAREKGWTTTTPVPGALVVWPVNGGRHVEMLVSEVSPGVWNTIGGNVSDSVQRKVRALTDCTLVVSPELRHAKPSQERVYFLEDPGVTARLYGPWRTRRARERAISRLSPDKRAIARRVRVKGKYAFELGRKVYGPWLDEQGRDEAKAVLERRLGRKLRPFSRVRQSAGTAGAPEALGKTT